MKDMNKKLIMTALALFVAGAASLWAQPAEGSFGGVFVLDEQEAAGEMAREGRIVIISNGDGGYWFDVQLTRKDGQTAHFAPTGDAWVPAAGRDFSYNVVADDYDYTMEVEFLSSEGIVVREQFNAGASPFDNGMTLGGSYTLDYSYVPTTSGYLFQMVQEGEALELCRGGRYSGTIELPASVSANGQVLPVVGIGEKAFWNDKDVDGVRLDPDKQYVRQSAYYGSGIYYAWDYSFSLPSYAYPADDLYLFVRPTVPQYPSFDSDRWFLFKHNYAPLAFVKDRSKDETAQWGYNPMMADRMQGAYYEMRVLDAVRKEMFRGYTAGEIIGLVAGSDFLAQHRFPAFSRWKWGEREQTMGAALEKQMAQRYGRTLRKSRYIGNLREEDGRLGLFEFEPLNGEAMVVFAWVQGGKVKATYVETALVRPGDAGSVWNVDDEGDYGIPDLLCVAIDPVGNVILWLNHSAPESKNIFGLRQQGDQFQVFGKDSWYVYVN